jgi:hypothetical protein
MQAQCLSKSAVAVFKLRQDLRVSKEKSWHCTVFPTNSAITTLSFEYKRKKLIF